MAESQEVDVSQIELGLIGMGEMGRMYADKLKNSGIGRINVCDRPESYESLKEELKDSGINVLRDGHLVSRLSDFIIYSVEASLIDKVVATYGPSTKKGAIVGGQTSVKAPEREAFEKYLPDDVHIVSVHSLHGPTVNPENQALILIKHRATEEKYRLVEKIMRPLRSNYVPMTYDEHDLVTANTQAVTHAAFLSMGTAWCAMKSFPWENDRYIGGIENVKINITLRIYSSKWHVYAGLAILNPAARSMINQFARSATDIFKMMVEERETELRERLWTARKEVFGFDSIETAAQASSSDTPNPPKRGILPISDKIFDKFAVGSPIAPAYPIPNSHLALLAMVDTWYELGIRPYHHLELAATPIFRLWFGVAEYLFRDEKRLGVAVKAAVWNKTHRSDDTEFIVAASGWSQCVSSGNFEWYRHRFESVAEFFADRFEESKNVTASMLKEVLSEGR